MQKYIIGIVVLAVVVVGIVSFNKPTSKLSGFVVPTITNGSSTVGDTDVLVYGPSQSLQYFWVENQGVANIYCWFNTTSTLLTTASSAANFSSGFRLDPLVSSSSRPIQISDPSLLSKAMHCASTGGVTSTMVWTKF